MSAAEYLKSLTPLYNSPGASYLAKAATICGYLALAQATYKVSQFLWFNIRPSSLPKYGRRHRLYRPQNGTQPPTRTWALVTGATDGLGLTLAEQLATQGFNVIIHGRNPSKLNKLKHDLETTHKISVRTLVIDAETLPTASDTAGNEAFDKLILSTVSDIPLTVLVNNIAVLGEWLAMHERTGESIDRYINMNVKFMTQLTRLLIPVLNKNNPGLVLNISSGAEDGLAPYSAPYAGAKAYSSALTRSLRIECKLQKFNLEVMTVKYGFICTASAGRTDADATFDAPTATKAAKDGLACVGCGRGNTWACLGHQVLGIVSGLMSSNGQEGFVGNLMAQQRLKMAALAAKKA